MLEILCREFAIKHANGGRKPKLPIAAQLLAILEYIREYRPYVHIAASYRLMKPKFLLGLCTYI